MTRRTLIATLRRRLVALRTERGLDQKQFATLRGVPASTISATERRLYVPSVFTLHRIAVACDTSLATLLEGL